MKVVLNKVLEQDPKVRAGTSAYVDDIMVNETREGRGSEGAPSMIWFRIEATRNSRPGDEDSGNESGSAGRRRDVGPRR